MRHDDPRATFPEPTHEQMCEAIETAHRMRAQALHAYGTALFRRLRRLFARRPGPAAAKSDQGQKRAPDWCVARDLGSRRMGVAS